MSCHFVVVVLFIGSDKLIFKPNTAKGAAIWNDSFITIADYENSKQARNYGLDPLYRVISCVAQNELRNRD